MPIKFYILGRDYSDIFIRHKKYSLRVDEGTSVIAYKKWFFDCLRQFGEIVLLNEELPAEKFRNLLMRKNAIFVSVNFRLQKSLLSKVPHRLLRLSLGSLLLPHNLYNFKYLPSAHVELVSTQFQLECLKSCLGDFTPKMAVFASKINTDYYVAPDNHHRLVARRKQGISKDKLHVIYAGRWIVTKGICQLIRTLDIWPLSNIVLTLVGNIEEENRLDFSFAHHRTFSLFLNAEILRNKRRPWLRFQETKDKEELRDLFWSADLFVNPSFQPDENFGITARQAMSCGLPIVTTNFCGLRPLAEQMPWRGIDTYPTLVGSRFSLRQLRVLLGQAIIERDQLSEQQCRNFIIKEGNPKSLKDNLAKAIRYLRNKPAERAIDPGTIERQIKRRIFNYLNNNNRIFKCFIETRKELPSGAYVYGDGPFHYAFPVAQGLYSAMNAPPRVEKKSRWRGFFRIALWEKEHALVEFGFPGPRIRRYPDKLWNSLVRCAHRFREDEYVIIPEDKEQILITQELVDLGYLVSDND